MVIKRCIVCGLEFKGTGQNSKYCSIDCKKTRDYTQRILREAKNPYATCAVCGSKFRITKTLNMYCSYACKLRGIKDSKLADLTEEDDEVKKIRKRSKHDKNANLAADAVMARKRGMSYGEYMGLKYLAEQEKKG